MSDIKMPYSVFVALVRYFICDDTSDDVKGCIENWITAKSESLQRREEYRLTKQKEL